MTTENAPSELNSSNKRVRFEDPTSAQNDLPSLESVSSNQSPKGLALSLVRTFTVSLRKHLSPIVQKCGESNLDLLHKLITKMNQYNKMDDDPDYIPRSANLINFDFRVTKQVESHAEFFVIKADTDILMTEFKKAIKLKIMEALQLECRLLREQFYENICMNLHLVVKAQLISDQTGLDPHKVIATIINHYFDELFDYTDLTITKMNETYKKTHALPVFPFPTNTPIALDNLMDDNDGLDTPVTQPTIEALPATISKNQAQPALLLIRGIFTRPGTAYFAREEAIKIDISLKKLLNTNTLEEATEATKERLDNENSMDNELMDEMVQKKVTAKTKNLNAELGQLKKQLAELTRNSTKGNVTPATKKSGRGQSATKGASTRKKKSNSTSQKPKKDAAQKAAAPAKGTLRKESERKGKREKKKKQPHKRK